MRKRQPSIPEDRPWSKRDSRVDSESPEAGEEEIVTAVREAPPVTPQMFWQLWAKVEGQAFDARIERLEKERLQQSVEHAARLESAKKSRDMSEREMNESFALRLEAVRAGGARQGRIEGAVITAIASVLAIVGGYLWSRIVR